jgi:hypothetical protein
MLSAAIALTLAGTIAWGLLPLAVLGRRLLFVVVALLPLSMLFVRMDLIPLANVTKIVAATLIGMWISQEIQRPSWAVAVAVLSATVDIVSVAVGPTRMILDHGPMVIGYFTVTMTWFGYAWSEAHSAIGISDFIFLGLYLGAARRFGLREHATAVAMIASFLVTLALALWWKALPALPLLSVAFLAVNADLLLRRWAQDAPDDAGTASPPAV